MGTLLPPAVGWLAVRRLGWARRVGGVAWLSGRRRRRRVSRVTGVGRRLRRLSRTIVAAF